MDNLNIKNQIINNYLSQQLMASGQNGGGVAQQQQQHQPADMSRAVKQIEIPDPQILEEFKNQVKAWIEIDNTVKKLQGMIRERNIAKQQLTNTILGFMSRYNIEDLNTKDGKLRYKVSQVKVPLSKTTIQSRLMEYYDPNLSAEELAAKVFETTTEVKEKHSLRRFKPRGA